jgi:hypothetical protein
MGQKSLPVLIYVAGLGSNKLNSADAVGDVIADALDLRKQPTQYQAKTEASVTAPAGLKASKGIYEVGTDACILQLFELDYKGLFQGSTSSVGPSVSPGVVRSSQYALFGMVMLIGAVFRRSKGWAAKVQIVLGFFGVAALMFAWLMAIFAGLVAAGVDFPGFLGGIFGETAAGWWFGISGTAAVVTWAALRKSILSFATTIGRLIDYVRNAGRVRDDISLAIDRAINDLRDNEWSGDIHLLGYSFGSLVCFDAAFPDPNSLLQVEAFQHVKSFTAIGCPLDLVRLYVPSYAASRVPRKQDLPWTNVFNAADIFGSNLKNKNDDAEATTAASVAEVLQPYGDPVSIRYTSQKLGLLSVLMARGFRTHDGYWGDAKGGSCFGRLISDWIPPAAVAAPPHL